LEVYTNKINTDDEFSQSLGELKRKKWFEPDSANSSKPGLSHQAKHYQGKNHSVSEVSGDGDAKTVKAVKKKKPILKRRAKST